MLKEWKNKSPSLTICSSNRIADIEPHHQIITLNQHFINPLTVEYNRGTIISHLCVALSTFKHLDIVYVIQNPDITILEKTTRNIFIKHDSNIFRFGLGHFAKKYNESLSFY